MIDNIKNLRKRIDTVVGAVGRITNMPSIHITKAENGLLLSKAWLGKILQGLDVQSPYPKDGERKTVADIEPTADKGEKQMWSKDATHIEMVDRCRQEIEEISNTIADLELARASWKMSVARTNSYTHSCQARFHLGFEFEEIRNESIKKK